MVCYDVEVESGLQPITGTEVQIRKIATNIHETDFEIKRGLGGLS